jgi:hypothetical protein
MFVKLVGWAYATSIVEKRSVLALTAIISVLMGALNYGIWLKNSLDLGGNALSGEWRDGHYFVANKGQYVEVTREEWEHNRLHTQSIFVTQPLMLLSLSYLVWTAARRRRRDGG